VPIGRLSVHNHPEQPIAGNVRFCRWECRWWCRPGHLGELGHRGDEQAGFPAAFLWAPLICRSRTASSVIAFEVVCGRSLAGPRRLLGGLRCLASWR
jgi:hypothetical protein